MANPWLTFVNAYRKKNPNLSYKEVLKKAKVEYKKTKSGKKEDKITERKLERDKIIQEGSKKRERDKELDKLGIDKKKRKELELLSELSKKKGGAVRLEPKVDSKAERAKLVRKYTDYKKAVQEGLRKGILEQKAFNHFIGLARILAGNSKTNKYAKDYKKIEKEFKSKKYQKLKGKADEVYTKKAAKDLKNLERLMERDLQMGRAYKDSQKKGELLAVRKATFISQKIAEGKSKEEAEKAWEKIKDVESLKINNVSQLVKSSNSIVANPSLTTSDKGKSKVAQRAAFVKKIAKEKNMSYQQANSYVKKEALWKGGKPVGSSDVPAEQNAINQTVAETLGVAAASNHLTAQGASSVSADEKLKYYQADGYTLKPSVSRNIKKLYSDIQKLNLNSQSGAEKFFMRNSGLKLKENANTKRVLKLLNSIPDSIVEGDVKESFLNLRRYYKDSQDKVKENIAAKAATAPQPQAPPPVNQGNLAPIIHPLLQRQLQQQPPAPPLQPGLIPRPPVPPPPLRPPSPNLTAGRTPPGSPSTLSFQGQPVPLIPQPGSPLPPGAGAAIDTGRIINLIVQGRFTYQGAIDRGLLNNDAGATLTAPLSVGDSLVVLEKIKADEPDPSIKKGIEHKILLFLHIQNDQAGYDQRQYQEQINYKTSLEDALVQIGDDTSSQDAVDYVKHQLKNQVSGFPHERFPYTGTEDRTDADGNITHVQTMPLEKERDAVNQIIGKRKLNEPEFKSIFKITIAENVCRLIAPFGHLFQNDPQVYEDIDKYQQAITSFMNEFLFKKAVPSAAPNPGVPTPALGGIAAGFSRTDEDTFNAIIATLRGRNLGFDIDINIDVEQILSLDEHQHEQLRATFEKIYKKQYPAVLGGDEPLPQVIEQLVELYTDNVTQTQTGANRANFEAFGKSVFDSESIKAAVNDFATLADKSVDSNHYTKTGGSLVGGDLPSKAKFEEHNDTTNEDRIPHYKVDSDLNDFDFEQVGGGVGNLLRKAKQKTSIIRNYQKLKGAVKGSKRQTELDSGDRIFFKAADDVYNAPSARHSLGSFKYLSPNSNAEHAIYFSKPENKVILAFRGSTTAEDWLVSDRKLAVGRLSTSPRFKREEEWAKRVINLFLPTTSFVMVGHSLGGTIAADMARKLGHKAVIFNAGYGVGMGSYKNADIKGYSTVGDLVSAKGVGQYKENRLIENDTFDAGHAHMLTAFKEGREDKDKYYDVPDPNQVIERGQEDNPEDLEGGSLKEHLVNIQKKLNDMNKLNIGDYRTRRKDMLRELGHLSKKYVNNKNFHSSHMKHAISSIKERAEYINKNKEGREGRVSLQTLNRYSGGGFSDVARGFNRGLQRGIDEGEKKYEKNIIYRLMKKASKKLLSKLTGGNLEKLDNEDHKEFYAITGTHYNINPVRL